MTKNIFPKNFHIAFLGLLLGLALALQTAPVLAEQMAGKVPAANTTNRPAISKNWSGYSATGGTFSSVGGSWIIPEPSALGISADATWVGIGGVTSKDLIQAGTQTIFTNGQANYLAWYELLPQTSHNVPLTVNPGDSVTVSISQQASNKWDISFHNNTSGKSYDTKVNYNSSLSSAEWIEEAPSSGRGILPLDNFGSVHFSDLWTVKNGTKINPAQAGARSINMANMLGQVIAQSSVLANDGASFAISRTASSSQPAYYLASTGGGWRRIVVNVRGFRSNHGYSHYQERSGELS